jgi:MFS family permease
MQLSTEPAMRGRVMAIRLAIAIGGTPIGAPIVGAIADRFGPRWAMGVGAAAGVAGAIVMIHYLAKYRRLRVHVTGGRLRFTMNEAEAFTLPR